MDRLQALDNSVARNQRPPSPTPTTSQLFSIPASNHNLQQLIPSYAALPNNADEFTLIFPPRDLTLLALEGGFLASLGRYAG